MPGIDKQEFIELFNRYYKPVKNFVYFKTGDIDLSDDIAQDTFVKIWERKNDIKPETIKPLLYVIAGNLTKNRFEHQRVVFEFTNSFKPEVSSASPEFEMELKEFNVKLQQAISELKEKDRTVFLMNRIEGLTYNQIAENLGLTVKAIEKRMKNALSELKKTIEYKI